MKLILDFGNTLQKIAIFEGDMLIVMHAYKKITLKKLQEFIAAYPVKSAILSAVIDYPHEIKSFLNKNFYFIEFNATTKIPIKNNYASRATLGNDRLAAAVAANYIFPNQNVLVVNAGTCITYEFVNNNNEYLGGAISPGIGIRFKALHNFTVKLPLIEKKIKTPLIGNTTDTSILSGVMNGVYSEVDGVISKYSADYNDLKIILSGGDIKYFANSLKNSIFAVSNIVSKGLNIILDFNAEK
jgi:type III pantothenate kinase